MDWVSAPPDVDTAKIALAGLSFGGSLAPTAASHDNRYSAIIAIKGLASMQEGSLQQLPSKITGPFLAVNATAFNEVIAYAQANSSYPSSLRWLIVQSLFAFNTTDAYDWFTRLGNITLSPAMVVNISAPVFVGKGQDDTLTLNQPEIAYEMFSTGRPYWKELTHWHEFNTSLGAGEHCQLGAEAQLWAAVMEWLSDVWDDYNYVNT